MSHADPAVPNLEYLKKPAKTLLKAHQQTQPEAIARIRERHPRLSGMTDDAFGAAAFTLQDAQLVLAREHGFASWPKLVVAISASTGDGTVERVLAQAQATDSARGIPQLLNTLFEEMVSLGILQPESGICYLTLFDESNGWYRPHALRRHTRHWGISCAGGFLSDVGENMFVLRVTRRMSEADEALLDTMARWRAGKPWWQQETEREEGVIGLLTNNYQADKVTPEFVQAYAGVRWAVNVPFTHGVIRWADREFDVGYVDLAQKLVDELARGLPPVGRLEHGLGA
jgi:hypothetical protein